MICFDHLGDSIRGMVDDFSRDVVRNIQEEVRVGHLAEVEIRGSGEAQVVVDRGDVHIVAQASNGSFVRIGPVISEGPGALEHFQNEESENPLLGRVKKALQTVFEGAISKISNLFSFIFGQRGDSNIQEQAGNQAPNYAPSAPFEEDLMEGSRPPAESPEYLRELEGYEAN